MEDLDEERRSGREEKGSYISIYRCFGRECKCSSSSALRSLSFVPRYADTSIRLTREPIVVPSSDLNEIWAADQGSGWAGLGFIFKARPMPSPCQMRPRATMGAHGLSEMRRLSSNCTSNSVLIRDFVNTDCIEVSLCNTFMRRAIIDRLQTLIER